MISITLTPTHNHLSASMEPAEGAEDERPHHAQGQLCETAIKQMNVSVDGRAASKDLLQTPSPMRLQLYRPSSLKLLEQTQADQGRSGVSLTCVVVARIEAIRNEGGRYWFQLSDETAPGGSLLVYFSRAGQATMGVGRGELESVEQLEFEPTREDGHPYFKLWLRESASGWLVEQLQRVRDCNEVCFHSLCIIYDQLRR